MQSPGAFNAGRRVRCGHRRAVEIVALHDTCFVAGAQVEDGILHSGRIKNALLEKVGVGFPAGVRERGAEKIEAVV